MLDGTVEPRSPCEFLAPRNLLSILATTGDVNLARKCDIFLYHSHLQVDYFIQQRSKCRVQNWKVNESMQLRLLATASFNLLMKAANIC